MSHNWLHFYGEYNLNVLTCLKNIFELCSSQEHSNFFFLRKNIVFEGVARVRESLLSEGEGLPLFNSGFFSEWKLCFAFQL